MQFCRVFLSCFSHSLATVLMHSAASQEIGIRPLGDYVEIFEPTIQYEHPLLELSRNAGIQSIFEPCVIQKLLDGKSAKLGLEDSERFHHPIVNI